MGGESRVGRWRGRPHSPPTSAVATCVRAHTPLAAATHLQVMREVQLLRRPKCRLGLLVHFPHLLLLDREENKAAAGRVGGGEGVMGGGGQTAVALATYARARASTRARARASASAWPHGHARARARVAQGRRGARRATERGGGGGGQLTNLRLGVSRRSVGAPSASSRMRSAERMSSTGCTVGKGRGRRRSRARGGGGGGCALSGGARAGHQTTAPPIPHTHRRGLR